jgi:3-oxoacyl-[acyl-carrier protein] reductase
LIVVVGAGSSLLGKDRNLEKILGDTVLYVSRRLPTGIKSENWVETRYDPMDQSIEKVANLQGVSSVIWLASPWHKSLFGMQAPSEVEASLTQGVLFQSLFVREILTQMIASRHGRFIFTGSSIAKAGYPGSLVYTQIKSAQAALSRGLAIEYGRLGITSNVINLGLLESGMADDLPPGATDQMLKRTGTGMRVEVLDFWNLVSFVLGNSSMNGAEIPLDGGFH